MVAVFVVVDQVLVAFEVVLCLMILLLPVGLYLGVANMLESCVSMGFKCFVLVWLIGGGFVFVFSGLYLGLLIALGCGCGLVVFFFVCWILVTVYLLDGLLSDKVLGWFSCVLYACCLL